MFSGFTPGATVAFFERRIVPAMLFAFVSSSGAIGYGFYASGNAEKAIVASLEEAEIEAIDEPEPEPEEEEPEEEIEEEEIEEVEEVEELPPEPQARPTPVAPPDVVPQDIPDELPEASDKASDGPRQDDNRPTGTGTGGRPTKKKKAPPPDEGSKPKKVDLGDVDKPRNRVPEGGTPAKRISGEPPEYPKACRKRNIEGKYTLLLHIDKTGAVKGAKVIKKSNSAGDPEAEKKAHSLFLKAIQAAVKTWKYKPAKYGKQTFAVWKRVSIPFELKGG